MTAAPMDEIAAKLVQASTATVSMQLLKRGLRNIAIRGPRPISADTPRIAGPAFTLRFIPAREDLSDPKILNRNNLAQRLAIEQCPAGHVLVVDALGCRDAGTIGDILAERLQRRGVAGLVSDGMVRDHEGVVATGLPVFACGAAAPASLTRLGDGDYNVPIGCGGVAVIPGDYIVADADGAIVVPQAMAAEVADGALEQERLERFVLMRVKGGAAIPGTYPPNEDTLAAYRDWVAAGEPEF